MREPNHHERADLNAERVREVDGVREGLAKILVLADGGAVVIIDGLHPNGHPEASGSGHLLHERAVAELVDGDHRDEVCVLPAKQRE